ncbi:MAG: peptide chain release factor N(5)-glutamine methyltransferase [Pseudomonadota bacterium]
MPDDGFNSIDQIVATQLERGKNTEGARRDIEFLLGELIQKPLSWVLTHGDVELSDGRIKDFSGWCDRYFDGEPIGYITGTQWFWNDPFKVTPDVLVPRPETECVVEFVIAGVQADKRLALNIADLGTGSGALGLSLAKELPDARLLLTDISTKALSVANANAQNLGIQNVEFLQSCWFDELGGRTFDIVVANPPYVARGDSSLAESVARFEPEVALYSEDSGYRDLKQIAGTCRSHLAKNGLVIVEHGFQQADVVQTLFEQAELEYLCTGKDYAGHDRFTACINS